ncbi:hypothetical protein MRB53_008497 [Persea americana]|uniref:Uncharacterized protein n=1 Tax=Persea americana TaxID=3435 RepID=A0ACC2MLX3_PERAE|nr:hypothetical protein MRB53_008497 [Persea americana]
MEWLQVRRRWGSPMVMAVVADGYKELRDGGAANLKGASIPSLRAHWIFTSPVQVKSTSFELKFNEATDGGSVCKLSGEYETIEDRLPTEEETEEMIGGMIGMFKAVEGYLLANPDAYA